MLKDLFKKHLAQTTNFLPIQLEIERAEGVFLFDKNGKKYIDLLSGVAVNNLGHRHPAIIEAIQKQLDKYLHLMVYGEFVQKETVELAELLASVLPQELNKSFFLSSGSEAIEGAIKVAKLYTKRNEVISFKNSYHGSTLGTLNLLGDEKYKRNFRPLIPNFKSLEFNNESELQKITNKTACVVIEPIQTAAGMITPENNFLTKVRKRCNETNALLVFDEIQTALGRSGKLFAFETYNAQPDILCLAKSLGGGLPISAFISSQKIMKSLENGHPLLGHATTFGGHPLSCSAAIATLKILLKENIISEVEEKSSLFIKALKHPLIKEIRGKGLLLAVELGDKKLVKTFIENAINNGLLTYSFLFNETAFSIMPPLTITKKEIKLSCKIILKTLDSVLI